jgi:hypothetical protein
MNIATRNKCMQPSTCVDDAGTARGARGSED